MVSAPIVREGYTYIAVLATITIVLGVILNPYWSIIPGVITVFCMFFFRNPRRKIPHDKNLILSPADGTVMEVSEVFEEQFLNAEGTKVSIFLSVFNVHVNRSPIEGEIKFQQYTVGRFKPAFKATAGFENERHSIGLEQGATKLLVTQVAGLIARRIVSWVTLGNVLKAGQRYGMIKFGSCTEIITPLTIEVLVKKGDKVIGGETIIGRLKQ